MFRRATYADAAEMSKIFNQALRPGIFAISKNTPDTCNQRVAWLAEHQDRYPAFVYEIDNNRVIGWCSLNSFSLRPEYEDVAETSRYIDEHYRDKGLGRMMTDHLIEAATQLGFRLLVSNAFEKNLQSIKSGFKFQRVAVLHEAACVKGEWQNVVYLWKKLR